MEFLQESHLGKGKPETLVPKETAHVSQKILYRVDNLTAYLAVETGDGGTTPSSGPLSFLYFLHLFKPKHKHHANTQKDTLGGQWASLFFFPPMETLSKSSFSLTFHNVCPFADILWWVDRRDWSAKATREQNLIPKSFKTK